MSFRCPHCRKSLGGPATEGGYRARLAITLLDKTTGRVHGPCPYCKSDVTIADSSTISKALKDSEIVRPGLPVNSGGS